MKVQIAISISGDRLTAQTSDGAVWLDEPALVALVPDAKSPTGTLIAAIGSDARTAPGATRVVPAFSATSFDPSVTCGVIEWAAKFTWSRCRPQLKGFVAALDRVEVRVELADYAALPVGDRKALHRRWPYDPQMHWWLNGEKVRGR